MKGIVKNTVIITLITLIAGVLLGLVYEITKDPIAKQNELAKQEACEMVFAGAESFDAVITGEDADIQAYITEAGYAAQTIDEVMEAKDASGNVLGYVSHTEIIPVGAHEGVEPPVEQTWTYNGYVYTGYYCGVCEMMIVTSKVPVEAQA